MISALYRRAAGAPAEGVEGGARGQGGVGVEGGRGVGQGGLGPRGAIDQKMALWRGSDGTARTSAPELHQLSVADHKG